MRARHLVTVWDPSRGPDPLQAHLQLLLDLRRQERAGEVDDEDVYVWWGKIRSPNRQQPLPHLHEILSLDDALRGEEGPDAEVHLYLTDYRSLYVGHVGEVTARTTCARRSPSTSRRSTTTRHATAGSVSWTCAASCSTTRSR